jgi:hypothetical protein
MTAFINQAVAESNQGYVNSRVPITMALRCIVDSSISSNTSFGAMLDTFSSSASKLFVIVAHLLIKKIQILINNFQFYELKTIRINFLGLVYN